MLMQPTTPALDATVVNPQVPLPPSRLAQRSEHLPQRADIGGVEGLVLAAVAVLGEDEEVGTGGGEFVEGEEMVRREGGELVA